MHESECIIVDGIPDTNYDKLIKSCVQYAIISVPFTVNRMSLNRISNRILNIAKGKIAEKLFEYFCVSNKIDADFKVCSTPFWTTDNRDFILKNNEWDIKNNFIYHQNNVLRKYNYTDLPALVPNRFSGDQWSKRNLQQISNSNNISFLFTFLKSAGIERDTRNSNFLEIILTNKQTSFLQKLCKFYQGNSRKGEPFTEKRFWDEMAKLGETNYFILHNRPNLIITGFANSNHWDLFKNTGPNDYKNNFQKYLTPGWYTKTFKGSLNFMNGTLWTKITNAATPVSKLPSFLSLFPSLKNNMNCGHLK